MAIDEHIKVGDRFNKLVAITVPTRKDDSRWYFWCRCDCGIEKEYRARNVMRGDTKSCGCLSRSLVRTGPVTHGQSGSPAWQSYHAMLTRCHNPKSSRFANYGGLGIKVCEHWMAGFANFLADMGPRPDGHTLDRIDVIGDYTPENCRWATVSEQANNKRNSVVLTLDGESMTVSQWARKLGVGHGSIRVRIAAGWSIRDALSVPFVLGRNQYD